MALKPRSLVILAFILIGFVDLLVLAVCISLPNTVASLSDQVYGEVAFSAGVWVISPTVTITATLGFTEGELTPGYSCVLPAEYWRGHPEVWPTELVIVGGVEYSKDDALSALAANDEQDAVMRLAQQVIVAQLNILQGADPSQIIACLEVSQDWLALYPPGSTPSQAELKVASALTLLLTQFNGGLYGSSLCPVEPSLSQPATMTPVVSDTPTPTQTITPTENYPTPTTPISPPIEETPTPAPTSTPEVSPSATPTLSPTAMPEATDTPEATASVTPTLTPSPEASSTPIEDASPTPSPGQTPETSDPTPTASPLPPPP